MKPFFAIVFLIAGVSLGFLSGYRQGSVKGLVMGEDYTTLLGNPGLTLQVEQGPGTAYFVWTSENPARIEEVLRMGAHMQAAKHDLELQGEGLRDDYDPIRTAKNAGGQ